MKCSVAPCSPASLAARPTVCSEAPVKSTGNKIVRNMRRSGQVTDEPVAREPGDLFERAGFFEEVRRTGHDDELDRRVAHPAHSFLIKLDHDGARNANDEERPSVHQ